MSIGTLLRLFSTTLKDSLLHFSRPVCTKMSELCSIYVYSACTAASVVAELHQCVVSSHKVAEKDGIACCRGTV